MKNKLIDIHNSLMLSLEMLDDDELFEDPDKARQVIDRAKAKAAIAKTIVDVDRLGFDAARYSVENGTTIPSAFRLTEKVTKNETPKTMD